MILLTDLADLSLKLKQGYDNIVSRHSDFFSFTFIAELGIAPAQRDSARARVIVSPTVTRGVPCDPSKSFRAFYYARFDRNRC
jgi:hypothetical protein